jgi:hypothetical protein
MTTYDSIKYKSTTISNLNDTGTEGSKLAVGTTAQRGSTTGQFRYNSTTEKFEGKNASSFIVLEATPTITSIDDTEVDSAGGGNQTIVITGTNFATGDAVSFIGTSASFNAATTTIDSATQITAVAPKSSFLNAQEPYGVRVTSSSGLAGNLESQINVDNAPTWTTASGNLGTIQDDDTGTHFTLVASDAEGDTVAYTETGATNISGAGLALNSSTGAISGDPTDVGSSTTVSFTGRATAGSKTADRAFNIIITPPPSLLIGSTATNFTNSGATASKTTSGYETVTVTENMSVYVDLWGAGGGDGDDASEYHSRGGAGGMAYGQITLLAGTTYVVLVGIGGQSGNNDYSSAKFPDNGLNTGSQGNKGHGGGSTRFGLYTQSGFNITNSASDYNNSNAVYQLIAGAGGGGSVYATWSGTLGGYGGGTSGADGGGYYHADGSSAPGGGASQSSGGSGGTGGRSTNGSAGGKYSGGDSAGAAGGGGYYGGGGAAAYYAQAGGGSGYINTGSGLLSNTGFQTASAGGTAYYTPPNGTRSNRPAGTGSGTAFGGIWSTSSGLGGNGAVVFTKV